MRRAGLVLGIVGLVGLMGALLWRAWSPPPAVTAPQTTEVPVRVATITRTTVRRWVTAYGTVEAAPAGGGQAAGGVWLAAPQVGVVAEVACTEGQRVESGALLVRLASPAADVAAEFARTGLARERRLLGIGGSSQKVVQEAERQLAAAEAERGLFRVVAPFAGIVARVNVRPGEVVDPSMSLAELVDPDRLVVTAGVPATEVAGLVVGRPVELTASGAPVAAGTLSYVSPDVDPETGLARVRVAVPPGSRLQAGRFVRLRIVAEERPDRLTAPAESIVTTPDGGSTIAVVTSGSARRVPIERGLRDGDLVEITAPALTAGMTVVTEGAWGLPAETRIRVLGDAPQP